MCTHTHTHTHTHTERDRKTEIYYKELAHVIMEADKFQGL